MTTKLEIESSFPAQNPDGGEYCILGSAVETGCAFLARFGSEMLFGFFVVRGEGKNVQAVCKKGGCHDNKRSKNTLTTR